jgi:carbon storage regulator
MLVLTRRIGETIVIDNAVRVTVLEVKGERVRLGIAAPSDVLVDRQEIHERRKQFEPRREAAAVLAGHDARS